MNSLEAEFDRKMRLIYKKAKEECNYIPTRYLQMLGRYGGLKTAKKLLAENKIHDGLVELYLCGRLDLTVEALVIEKKYKELFSEEEIRVAKKRLHDLNYPK